MTEKKFNNSQCNDCHWKNQCGEEEMFNCSDHDPISQEAEDRYINTYIERGRSEYRQEWNDYMDYLANDQWGDKYDR